MKEEELKAISSEHKQIKSVLDKIKDEENKLVDDIDVFKKSIQENSKEASSWRKKIEEIRKLHVEEQVYILCNVTCSKIVSS